MTALSCYKKRGAKKREQEKKDIKNGEKRK
jgi:hypothetical protein